MDTQEALEMLLYAPIMGKVVTLGELKNSYTLDDFTKLMELIDATFVRSTS